MKEYIRTLSELKNVAIANLGPMDKGDFNSFTIKAKEEAVKQNIKNPLLVIDVEFKEEAANEFGVKEQPYPISEAEWKQCALDGKTMTEHMPDVYVVDGDKFTAPI